MNDKDVWFRPIILKRNVDKGCGFVSISDTSLGLETWNYSYEASTKEYREF